MSTGVARSLATEMTTVGDVMTRNLLTVEQETTLIEAAAAMTGRAVGSGDVGGTVAEWMTRGPETVDADETTQQAGVVMIHGGFRHLPVLEGGAPVGIVSIRDLMRVVLDDVSPCGV